MSTFKFAGTFRQNEIGWFCKATDITDLMSSTIRGHLNEPSPDAVLNIETHLFNVTLQSESSEFDIDVGKELWLNKQRWSRLIREYVPLEPLNRLIDQAVEILDGSARDGATANMMFRDPDRYAKKHRWGGCLMGATFRGNNKKAGKPMLTIYSRTTYMGYMALLDAAIAACISREIQKRAKITTPIGFRWHISSQQLHCFKTLPYIFSQPDLFEQLEQLSKQNLSKDYRAAFPTWYHTTKWYQKILEAWQTHSRNGRRTNKAAFEAMLANEKYGPLKRIKRRWCEHMGYSTKNVPPSLKLDQLDFEKAE